MSALSACLGTSCMSRPGLGDETAHVDARTENAGATAPNRAPPSTSGLTAWWLRARVRIVRAGVV